MPAQFNDAEIQIFAPDRPRGVGSTTKVNGREARARDVQTLFADVSAGAHSTAWSPGAHRRHHQRQTDRPARLLEEAAGITGLHSSGTRPNSG